MPSTQMTNVQQRSVTLTITDFDGRARTVDGVPVWLSEDPTLCEVVPAPDGMSATIRSTGVVGATRVNVVVDVDMGENVMHQTGTFDVTITESGEIRFNFAFGDPTHR